jgi:hypothetical protein
MTLGAILLWSSHIEVDAWMTLPQAQHSSGRSTFPNHYASKRSEVDVSDLGVTMDDLEAPLPADIWQTMATSGYESTSRIPTVDDQGCKWTEAPGGKLDVQLTIPGLRGQPAPALAVECATYTVTVTAFGQIVWSAILRGEVQPESLEFQVDEGTDRVPVIDLTVLKASPSDERWGGFILQIGENSIL